MTDKSTRSYLVFASGHEPMQVDCSAVEFRDGCLIFLDASNMPLCAFAKWSHINVMNPWTGYGAGFTPLEGDK